MFSNIRNLTVLILSLAFLAACHPPQYDIPPGNKEVEFSHDGLMRRTNFYIPKKLKRKKRSLVLCLHSEGETPESMMRLTKKGFDNSADQEGFIIGYPAATNSYWNDGREDSLSLSHYDDIDDVGFLKKLIQYSIDTFGIDSEQVFIAGMSNGGFMTFRLACELSGTIKGIAVVSAGLALDQLVDCNADSTISVMVINGTRDPVMPYEGGEMKIDEQSLGSVLSAEETIRFWLGENNCKEKFSHKDVANSDLFDETRAEKFTYSNCDNNTEVVLISVSNGGHTWPGGRQYAGEKNVGKTSDDFNAAEEIWRFFKGL